MPITARPALAALLPALAALGLCGCAGLRPAPALSGHPLAPAQAFEAARLHHERGDQPAARAALDALLARSDLLPGDRFRALTERGVVLLESGDLPGAERSLHEALAEAGAGGEASAGAAAPPPAGLSPQAVPKAHFWLGEVLRARFLAAPLDFAAPEEAQAAALETLARLLLEAQARYLGAALPGSGEFGVAAVGRVGELYEAFHRRLAAAPVPAGLSADERVAWRAELGARLEVLLAKAVEAYRAALEVARRGGAGPELIEELERSLARIESLRTSAGEPAPSGSYSRIEPSPAG